MDVLSTNSAISGSINPHSEQPVSTRRFGILGLIVEIPYYVFKATAEAGWEIATANFSKPVVAKVPDQDSSSDDETSDKKISRVAKVIQSETLPTPLNLTPVAQKESKKESKKESVEESVEESSESITVSDSEDDLEHSLSGYNSDDFQSLSPEPSSESEVNETLSDASKNLPTKSLNKKIVEKSPTRRKIPDGSFDAKGNLTPAKEKTKTSNDSSADSVKRSSRKTTKVVSQSLEEKVKASELKTKILKVMANEKVHSTVTNEQLEYILKILLTGNASPLNANTEKSKKSEEKPVVKGLHTKQTSASKKIEETPTLTKKLPIPVSIPKSIPQSIPQSISEPPESNSAHLTKLASLLRGRIGEIPK